MKANEQEIDEHEAWQKTWPSPCAGNPAALEGQTKATQRELTEREAWQTLALNMLLAEGDPESCKGTSEYDTITIIADQFSHTIATGGLCGLIDCLESKRIIDVTTGDSMMDKISLALEQIDESYLAAIATPYRFAIRRRFCMAMIAELDRKPADLKDMTMNDAIAAYDSGTITLIDLCKHSHKEASPETWQQPG